MHPAAMDEEQLSAYEAARLTIARAAVGSEAELQAAIAKATEAASEALDVERTSVWMLDEGLRDLRCVHLYVRGRGQVACEVSFRMTDYPRYAEAGETRKVIATTNAREDPRTREFHDGYLVPNGIFSMLDAPIFQSGRVVGMVCHEHCGQGPREWSQRDVDFAGSMADLVSLAFEQAARTAAERARAEAEQRLAAQEKMAALGRLATGVAHDLSNLLQLVSLQVDLLDRERKRLGEDGQSAIALLRDATDRQARLLQQLLVFAKNGRVARDRVDVSQVVSGMLPLFVGMAPEGRVVVTANEPGLTCLLDRAQLEQVVLNLVHNAIEAAPRGVVRVSVSRADRQVVLEVSDEGPGIPERLRERVFEPFFSTKERGSGLGLAVVRAITEANDGTLRLEAATTDSATSARSGTRFRLAFPLASD